MKTYRFSNQRLVQLFAGLTLLANLLILAPVHLLGLQAVIGFVWLFLVPGYLITRLIKLDSQGTWGNLSLYAGFSLLAVMAGALVVNTVLPWFGVQHPLTPTGLTLGYDVLWSGLLWQTLRRTGKTPTKLSFPNIQLGHLLLGLGGIPSVVLAVLGAISLNNGGTGLITLAMLIYSAGYLGLLVAKRRRVPETALLTGIYCVSLALLLMTSLRGWFTLGHDIQREYQVFALTLSNLHWSPAAYHDAYNACLSITVLPTVIHQVLGVDINFVYKTVFQALFALVPVMVYLLARRFTSRLVALLAATYFIAFPTYFQDMPMLNRQEIAYLFISLAFYAIFHETWSLKRRRWLLLAFGTGVVLSHYSTTYTMLFIFGLVIGLRYLMPHLTKPFGKLAKWQPTFANWKWLQPGAVSAAIVIALFGVSYVWSSQLTNTGGNLSRVAGATLGSIQQGLKGDTRSADTNYGLFSKTKLTDAERLDTYATTAVPELQSDIPAANAYTDYDYDRYPTDPVKASNLPLTALGQWLTNHGLNVATLNTAVRQGSALFLQLMLLIGLGILFLAKPFRRALSNEYRLFQLASVILIGTIIILPVLSAEYGLLRAFQQTLILSGAAIVIATRTFIPKAWRKLRNLIPTLIALGFLLSSTGVFTTILGGYPGQIHLTNSGKYYELFYPHEAEAQGARWLDATLPANIAGGQVVSTTETNRYFSSPNHTLQINLPQDNAYPALIRRDAYVFLGYTAVNQHQASLYYNGDDITYQYPVQFLDDNKDLIYSSQGARVYK